MLDTQADALMNLQDLHTSHVETFVSRKSHTISAEPWFPTQSNLKVNSGLLQPESFFFVFLAFYFVWLHYVLTKVIGAYNHLCFGSQQMNMAC